MGTTLITAAASLLGVIIGAVGSATITRRNWRREEARSLRVMIAELWRSLWGETPWGELRVELARLQVRADGFVSEAQLKELESATWACWKNSHEEFRQDPELSGISTKLLDAFEGAAAAIDSDLARISR